MKKFKLTDLLIFIVTAELTGAVSAILSGDFTSFYAEVIQPPLSPPVWLFPVVWAILYALMGVSAYMIWNTGNKSKERAFALKVYFVQLGVNFSWSIIFFRFRLLGVAAVVAVVLLVLVVSMTLSFSKVRRLAAKLNIPYLIWLVFASYLAIGTYILN